MALRGWTTLAWQADYGQFYLIDREDTGFQAPVEITGAMMEQSVFVPPAGIVVYTGDCLQQHIRIAIHDAEPEHPPVEPVTGKAWTRVQTVAARFPSRSFAVSSPSRPYPLPNGPVFMLDGVEALARIHWMEFQDSRDDSVPVEPDVIDIALWPRGISGQDGGP